eukprot:1698440-Pleurochrysis_carterae.AAC.1
MTRFTTTFNDYADIFTVTFLAPLPETNNFCVNVTPWYVAGRQPVFTIEKLYSGTGSPGFRVRLVDLANQLNYTTGFDFTVSSRNALYCTGSVDGTGSIQEESNYAL